MRTQYSVSFKGTTKFYATQDEAIKVARFCGLSASAVKIVDMY